jgi:short-subunit dehydrogenase
VQITEGLAIYLRPKGVSVSLLCPGPVRTNISRSVPSFGPRTDLRTPGAQFALLEPSAVADMVLDALEHRRFLIVTHPEVKDLLVARATDWDAFLDDQIAHPHVVKLG